ncbi:hypothetical protein [Propionispora hippei]|uniref:Uncharacterized protein n=1 Tax=Propionispora hippei DSM 15287 TaxID=1123003 RepID=A0A1M6GTB2_9FIRM|nr:hypothetical protein [Propionispora hippei]SHJ13191.1 hypothetical protein SAMN02745170_01820 [Propionispora hippei DSM 15287]
MLSHKNPREDDYDSSHDHIVAAKKLEPYYPLFEVFRTRDTKMVTLILAAARTIYETLGTFSYFELDQALGYLHKKNRHQVIDYLRRSRWIEHNGIDYEMSDRVKSFIYFIFTSLDRNDLSISQTIHLSLAEAEMSSMYNYSEDVVEDLYVGKLFSALTNQNDRLDRIIHKRDRQQIWKIVTSNEGKDIVKSIKTIQKKVRDTHSGVFASLQKQQDIHDLCSQLLNKISQLGEICNELIGENTRSIGEYITPDMLDAYLANASIEQLACIAEPYFAAPKQIMQLREETVIAKATTLFNNQPEDYVEMTPPPEPVSFIEEEVVSEIVGNPLDMLYHQIVARMGVKREKDIDDLLFENMDKFGMAVYRTGQTIKLCQDIEATSDSRHHRISFEVKDEMKSIYYGPVEEMNRTIVKCEKGPEKDGK